MNIIYLSTVKLTMNLSDSNTISIFLIRLYLFKPSIIEILQM